MLLNHVAVLEAGVPDAAQVNGLLQVHTGRKGSNRTSAPHAAF